MFDQQFWPTFAQWIKIPTEIDIYHIKEKIILLIEGRGKNVSVPLFNTSGPCSQKTNSPF